MAQKETITIQTVLDTAFAMPRDAVYDKAVSFFDDYYN